MDLSQFPMAAFALIGLVNGVQFAVNREWKSFVFFSTAVAFGALFGFWGWFGIPSVEIGFALGLASSGVYKTGQIIGGK